MSKEAQIIKDNPNCYIYYHDNGSWGVYTSKEDYEKTVDVDMDEEYFDKITLFDGSDDGFNGYVPTLVDILAEVIGIKVDSI